MDHRLVKPPGGPTDADRKALHRLIKTERLYVAFQPIVDVKTHEIFAYEALARYHEDHFPSPVELFETAIAENHCGTLGRLLRRMSVEAEVNVPLFLNVHPHEFDEGWLVRPDDPIFWHGDGVFLEITESVPLSHFALCQSVLAEIRAKGLHLAVDDLGAGFSNLRYIADLRPEMVKLDRGLVADLGMSARRRLLVKEITHLCVAMGAKVIAEGVETPEELAAVMDAGVHYVQGYLLARPAFPPPEVHWPKG